MEQKLSTMFDRVVLIHGIRTQAAWAEMVSATLRQQAVVEVTPIGYGYFDVFKFLSPFFTRERPVEKVTRELRQILKTTSHEKVLVIAHSFGTYIVTRILAENPDISFGGLILCGSVVSEEYRWDVNKRSIHNSRIVNECGDRDIWPNIAKSVSWGYGATGRLGFRSEAIRDRFHNLDHSGFFNQDFVRRFWIPLLENWSISDSDYSLNRGEAQWWLAPLSVLPLKSLALILLTIIFVNACVPPEDLQKWLQAGQAKNAEQIPAMPPKVKSRQDALPRTENEKNYKYSDHQVVPGLDQASTTNLVTAAKQLDLSGGVLVQEQTEVTSNGYFYMSVSIPLSDPLNEDVYQSSMVRVKPVIEPNLYISVQAKPSFSRGTVDIFGCNIVVVFRKKKRQIMFWSSEQDQLVVDLPVSINYDQYNTFALRQVGKKASAFVNGAKLAEYSFLTTPKPCRAGLAIKAYPQKGDAPELFGLNFQGLAIYEFSQLQ